MKKSQLRVLQAVVPIKNYNEFFEVAAEAKLTPDRLNFTIEYVSGEIEAFCKQFKGWVYLQTLILSNSLEELIGKVGGSEDDLGVFKRWDYLAQAHNISPGDHDGRMNSIIHHYLLMGHRVRFWAIKNPIPTFKEIVPMPSGKEVFEGPFSKSYEKRWKDLLAGEGKSITKVKDYNLPWNDRNVKYLLESLGLKSAKDYKRTLVNECIQYHKK